MSTLDPISIATGGYVCGGGPNDIAIATDGYVCPVEVIIIPVIKRGGSSAGSPLLGKPQKHKLKSIDDIEALKMQIMQEDEEILAVIVTLVRMLDGDS